MVFSLKLKNLIQPTYQSENLVKEFYEPVLSEATIYRRVSAYFPVKDWGYIRRAWINYLEIMVWLNL